MPPPTFIRSSKQTATEDCSNGDAAATRKVHRLTSISQFAKSFTRRRSTINSSDSSRSSIAVSTSTSNTISSTTTIATVLPPSSLHKTSPRPNSLDSFKDALPRSVTCSSLPNASSSEQSRQGSLPAASNLSNLFRPSRIPTPCSSNRRLSQPPPAYSMGPPPLPVSVSNKSLYMSHRRASARLSLDANILSHKSAEGNSFGKATDSRRIRLPDWENNVTLASSSAHTNIETTNCPRMSVDDYRPDDTLRKTDQGREDRRNDGETLRKQVPSSTIHPLAYGRQPSKSHEIVRHGLLKAIDPALALEAVAAIAAPRPYRPAARLSSASRENLSSRSPSKFGSAAKEPTPVRKSSLKVGLSPRG